MVIYFPPGIHRPGVIDIKSGQTVFIDTGAVVYGSVLGIGVFNASIVGGGILDASEENRDDTTLGCPIDANIPIPKDTDGLRQFLMKTKTLHGCIRLYNCQNIEINGIVCRDSAIWAILPAFCDNVVCDNIKVIGMWRYNSDGIDFTNCSNGIVKNSFVRAFDDCIVLKGIKGWDQRNVENIIVQNCVIWCDWGRAFEIGVETCADEFRNIIFENCDIIRGSHVMMDIQNTDRACVHDVIFRDIRCEYNRDDPMPVFQDDMDVPYPEQTGTPKLFVAKIYFHKDCSLDSIRGQIHCVTLENIQVLCEEGIEMPHSDIRGYKEDGTHRVTDVTFKSLFYNDERIKTPGEANIFYDTETTENIQVVSE
jgi:hypothetical protein